MDTIEPELTVRHPAMVSNPWFMLSILSTYLILISRVLPSFMLHRKPYQLKTFIIVHNIVQVLSCVFVVYEILNISENGIMYFWKCSGVRQSQPCMERHFRLAYFLFWLKISELLETIIFVLRKKQNQVTKLHVFHHISTVTLIYILINHNDHNGIDALFPIFLNSIVHIIMYTYYLVAATADKQLVRSLTPVKKSITVIQMVQFVLILLHTAITMNKCGVAEMVFYYFNVVILVNFYGFYDFYKTSYKNSERRKSAAIAAAAVAAAARKAK